MHIDTVGMLSRYAPCRGTATPWLHEAGAAAEAPVETTGTEATTPHGVCARVSRVTLYGTFCWSASHISTAGCLVNFVLLQTET